MEVPNFDEENLLQKLNPSMFSIIEMWYEGKSFMDITKKSEMYEGTIIRNIKRLYELTKSVIQCCESLGNKELMQKLDEAATKLYRGIAFTGSLYID